MRMTRNGHVYTPQKTAPPEEQQERAAKMKTQGRKGCKAVRINMAFTPANHKYVKTMSACMGLTMTEFVNLCIESHKAANWDNYGKATDVAVTARQEATP